MENQSRVQKIEEALEHLKYKDNILEFEQPRVDVTDQDATAEANPPRYCKKFDLNKVQATWASDATSQSSAETIRQTYGRYCVLATGNGVRHQHSPVARGNFSDG